MTDYLIGAVWISAVFCLSAISLYFFSRRRRTKPPIPWQKIRKGEK